MDRKLFKNWSYDYNEDKEEITILIQDLKDGWKTLSTVSECPRLGMSDEEFDEHYNDLLTEIIDESGYESIYLLTDDEIAKIDKELEKEGK